MVVGRLEITGKNVSLSFSFPYGKSSQQVSKGEIMFGLKQSTTALLFVMSPVIMAKDLTPKMVSTSEGVVTVQFDLSHMGQDCGLLVKWGDGAEKKIRIGRDVNEKDFLVTHSYSNSGGYIFEVEGSTIKKGLGTVFACQGKTYRQAICIGK